MRVNDFRVKFLDSFMQFRNFSYTAKNMAFIRVEWKNGNAT